MSGFTFVDYEAKELPACGQAFSQAFARKPTGTNGDWTQAIHDWFAQAAAPGVHVNDHKHHGEFIVDQCHTRFPNPQEGVSHAEQWRQALATPHSCEVLLALESEWGREGDLGRTFADILDDAHKLAVVRAKVKVLVFSSHSGRGDHDTIIDAIAKLRVVAGDKDPWLWIDIPSGGRWEAEGRDRKITYGILE